MYFDSEYKALRALDACKLNSKGCARNGMSINHMVLWQSKQTKGTHQCKQGIIMSVVENIFDADDAVNF